MKRQSSPFTLLRMLAMLLIVVLLPFLPLFISGRWNWWEAWVYAFVWIVGFASSRLLAARRNPDILAERARFTELSGIQPWDKWLSPIVGIGSGIIPIVAGVEALFRNGEIFALGVELAALAVILGGYALGSYALIENRFFSGVVRLQTDRGHHVVTGGPYHWMRHPGYAGALLTFLATPFFLDSLWGLLPAALLTIVLVVRTRLEDAFLQKELTGYAAYAKQVRYRLAPGIW